MDIRTPIPTIYGDSIARFGETWRSQVEKLREKFGSAIEEVRMPVEHPTEVPIVFVARSKLVEVLEFIKGDPELDYGFLSDITATDEMPADPRFEVVYNLFSISRRNRIRLKVRVREGETVPTAVTVWPAADWAEREVFDMFGVRFEGHPDLRRILMDERWQGHPLRKDYPIRGYQIFIDAQPAHLELLD